MKKVIIDSLT